MVNLERENGYVSGLAVAPRSWLSRSPSDYVVSPVEANPDLAFPSSVKVYDAMRRTDPQVSAALRALSQPVLSARWELVGDDVNPAVAEFVRSELGLVPAGDPRRRRRRHGIVFGDHLRTALTCMAYGFAVFEQVYEYDPTSRRLHLRKLGHRPATTIREIHVEKDGGLKGVTQEPAPNAKAVLNKPPFIPVEKLVWYSLDKEGADWTGTSVLRSAYKPWFLKERLERLAAQIVERNGMGIPVGYHTDQGGNEDELGAQLADLRAGAAAYLKLPPGTDVKLLGVSGSTVDPLPLIRMLDEYIARSLGTEFMMLGSEGSGGSYNLAEVQRDHMLHGAQAVADQIADTVTEHVIRDLVELNFGEDEPYPILVPGDLRANAGLDVADLKTLSEGGLITPDRAMEATLRSRYGLPPMAEDVEDDTSGFTGTPKDLLDKAQTFGVLYRSGIEPQSTLNALGLGKLEHTKLLPVTLQTPEEKRTQAREAGVDTELSEPVHLSEAHRLLDRLEELRGK